MISKKAISEYQSVQKMVGSNYSDKRVEEIVKRGVKYNIDIYYNEELINEIFFTDSEIGVDNQKAVEILEELIEYEKSCELS